MDLFEGTRVNENGQTIWNLHSMLGSTLDRFFYTYYGSETSGECLENYQWFVSREPLTLTSASLMAIN